MLRNRLNRAAIYSTAAYWDGKAADYQAHAVSMWPNEHLNVLYHREQLHFAASKLSQVANKRVLDAGCGIGRVSRYLAAQGAQVTGVDFAPRVIEIAQRTSPSGNPTYRVQSVFELDDVGTYDVVLCWGVLTVACRDRGELLEALTRIRRSLVPGGVFLLLEPIHRGFLHRVLDLDVAAFIGTMQEAGFRIQSVASLHFWPARLALAFVPWPRRLTEIGYHLGQGIMRYLLGGRMADYRGIHAVAAQSPTPAA